MFVFFYCVEDGFVGKWWVDFYDDLLKFIGFEDVVLVDVCKVVVGLGYNFWVLGIEKYFERCFLGCFGRWIGGVLEGDDGFLFEVLVEGFF